MIKMVLFDFQIHFQLWQHTPFQFSKKLLGPEKLFKKKWTIVQPSILLFWSSQTFPNFKIHTLPTKINRKSKKLLGPEKLFKKK